jgi:hypothetical protein
MLAAAPSTRAYTCGVLVLLAYLAYGVAGVVLERRAERYRVTPRRGRDRWDLAEYAAAGHAVVRWHRRWHRAQWLMWLGGVAAIIFLCGALGEA